jgi:hypothetical protein
MLIAIVAEPGLYFGNRAAAISDGRNEKLPEIPVLGRYRRNRYDASTAGFWNRRQFRLMQRTGMSQDACFLVGTLGTLGTIRRFINMPTNEGRNQVGTRSEHLQRQGESCSELPRHSGHGRNWLSL